MEQRCIRNCEPMSFSLAHVGINAGDGQEASAVARRFCKLFGYDFREGKSSVFAGGDVEVMRGKGLGSLGHIAIETPCVEKAVDELEARGAKFDPSTAKYSPDGVLKAIYLKEEIGGFAVHLLRKA